MRLTVNTSFGRYGDRQPDFGDTSRKPSQLWRLGGIRQFQNRC
jgi:hypothetical protein